MKRTGAQTLGSPTTLQDTGGDRQEETVFADTECHPQGSEIHIFLLRQTHVGFLPVPNIQHFRIIRPSHSPCSD
jgi:hypothetical protein